LLIIVFVRSARKGYLSSMDCVPEICENIPDICDGDCNPLS
jgi:hypothetical protein